MKIKPLIPSLLTLLAGSLNFATAATLSTPKTSRNRKCRVNHSKREKLLH